ncbi:cupredoxin domain-containing protein [Hylemonella gracilis]|uniref:Blue (Type1) copper domain-containing protein n=1 Tax=Hylemonella gracilis ATCC 19624 TaxID=887062 RepID=F3KW87_9BURK|nr:cupredoxin family protein [Hylemonella gracilis]EGI75960.1 blue (type1) copper domain-containing protein [Hylemonella gracilis ATCC 19624]
MNISIRALTLPLITGLLVLPAQVWAQGSHAGHDMGHATGGMHEGHTMAGLTFAAGRPGDPAKVNRTVPLQMDDTMRFTPADITVKAGETVRFFIVNQGQLVHEMVIGTRAELDQHAEMMKSMPGMQHAEPNQISLRAGQRGGIVWTFDKAGTFAFACLVPGHKEAGMVGTITVQP